MLNMESHNSSAGLGSGLLEALQANRIGAFSLDSRETSALKRKKSEAGLSDVANDNVQGEAGLSDLQSHQNIQYLGPELSKSDDDRMMGNIMGGPGPIGRFMKNDMKAATEALGRVSIVIGIPEEVTSSTQVTKSTLRSNPSKKKRRKGRKHQILPMETEAFGTETKMAAPWVNERDYHYDVNQKNVVTGEDEVANIKQEIQSPETAESMGRTQAGYRALVPRKEKREGENKVARAATVTTDATTGAANAVIDFVAFDQQPDVKEEDINLEAGEEACIKRRAEGSESNIDTAYAKARADAKAVMRKKRKQRKKDKAAQKVTGGEATRSYLTRSKAKAAEAHDMQTMISSLEGVSLDGPYEDYTQETSMSDTQLLNKLNRTATSFSYPQMPCSGADSFVIPPQRSMPHTDASLQRFTPYTPLG